VFLAPLFILILSGFERVGHEVRKWYYGVLVYGKVNVKVSRNRPGVAQRVPGVLGSQIFMTFDT
jgi:hypothetical protein